ncbi:hypothetical protein ACIQWR_35295 [Streptomyces sp. NPDC098789]|uniref:hypothetical protein n=1 Tax=Streptomyces sp. NPDC098789 TaxID=3366098 RepID=UPI003818956C
MHGPGLPPPRERYANQRSQSYVIALRVIFTLVPLFSWGFLAWASMLRLAIVTRAGKDWALFVLSATCGLLGLWLVGSDPVPDAKGTRTDIGMVLALATGVASLAYFLYADLRHHQRPPVTAWYPPPLPPQAQPHAQPYGYGYPPQPAAPAAPLPQPPHSPRPPRIGQVRAELDELSELLRKQGDSNGNGNGGGYGGGADGQGHGR